VQLPIFLIDLFVGTYRLSSHARLEAFVIQTIVQRKLRVCVVWIFQYYALLTILSVSK